MEPEITATVDVRDDAQETTRVDTPPDPDILMEGDNIQQTVDIDNPKIRIKVEVDVHQRWQHLR